MSDETKQIHISTPGELVIREGSALPTLHLKGIEITGTLGAPYQFLQGKRSNYDHTLCHITIKKDTGVIILNLDDQNPYTKVQIIGQLKKDGELDSWKINTDKRWTVGEFLKFIKTKKYHFSDRLEADALIQSLQTWSARVETVIKQHNDNAGNSLAMLEKKVSDIGLKTKFNLTIPLYQGYEKATFTVEIGFDPKTNSVDLYLISDELYEIEASLRESYIQTELDKFNDFNCSKVVVS